MGGPRREQDLLGLVLVSKGVSWSDLRTVGRLREVGLPRADPRDSSTSAVLQALRWKSGSLLGLRALQGSVRPS